MVFRRLFGGGRGSAPARTLRDDIPIAAESMAVALRSSGYSADFSLASLAEVDRFFDDECPDGLPRPGGKLTNDVGKRLFALGAYVGETLRKRVGGDWETDDTDPDGEVNAALHLPDHSVVWPIQRVIKRFRSREEGIAAYGSAIAQDTGAALSVDDLKALLARKADK